MSKKYLLPRSEVEVATWFERDRAHVWIRDKKTQQKTIAEWWDDEVGAMIEDGFFIRGLGFERSVLDYAEEVGLIASSGTRRNPHGRTGVRKNIFTFNNPPSGPADEVAARELEIFIDNDRNLYFQQFIPIVKNLMLKRRKGIYDREKAVKLFMYLMESGAKKYITEFGTRGAKIDTVFNKNTRLLSARRFRDSFETEAELGNYDRLIGPVSNPRGGVRKNIFTFNNPKRPLNAIEQAAADAGLLVTTWAPGDGMTRYRFFKKTGSERYADYHQGDALYTANGRADAQAFIRAYGIGRSARKNPYIRDSKGEIVQSSRNLRGIREYVGKHVVKSVSISKHQGSMGMHRDALLQVDFTDGKHFSTQFADWNILKNFVRQWRNVYGAPLIVNGVRSGKVDYHNSALRDTQTNPKSSSAGQIYVIEGFTPFGRRGHTPPRRGEFRTSSLEEARARAEQIFQETGVVVAITKQNPLTHRETSTVVESARFHARMARSITPGAPYRSHLLGVAEGQLNVASQYGRGKNRGRAGTMVSAIDRMAMAKGGPYMRFSHRPVRRNPAVCSNPNHARGTLENPYGRDRERRSYQDFLARKRTEYGSKFDASDLDPRFVQYYENGYRIWVNDLGDVKSGTVGVTTGWKPVFLLISSSRAMGSSITLTPKTKILGLVGRYKPRRGEYGQAIENVRPNPLLQTVFAMNPPVSDQWDRMTGRQRLMLLEFVGFDETAARYVRLPWKMLSDMVKQALEQYWRDSSARGTTRRRPMPVGANPLTRGESARILKRAKGNLRMASSFQGGHTRSEKSGQAFARAMVVKQYGPRAARRAAGKVITRAQKTVGTTMSNPGGLRLPKPGTKMTVSEAFELARRIGDRALIEQCRKALKLQKVANKNAKCVIWKTFAMGSPNKIDSVVALTHYGDSPETMYRPPKGSKKGSHMYRHKWGEKGGKTSVPLLASADGKMLLMPLEGKKVAGDWLRH